MTGQPTTTSRRRGNGYLEGTSVEPHSLPSGASTPHCLLPLPPLPPHGRPKMTSTVRHPSLAGHSRHTPDRRARPYQIPHLVREPPALEALSLIRLSLKCFDCTQTLVQQLTLFVCVCVCMCVCACACACACVSVSVCVCVCTTLDNSSMRVLFCSLNSSSWD